MTSYDDDMRTIVDIPERDIARLTEFSRREGISRAEAVRRAIALFLREQVALEKVDAFGLWRDREIDALHYEDKLRSEW